MVLRFCCSRVKGLGLIQIFTTKNIWPALLSRFSIGGGTLELRCAPQCLDFSYMIIIKMIQCTYKTFSIPRRIVCTLKWMLVTPKSVQLSNRFLWLSFDLSVIDKGLTVYRYALHTSRKHFSNKCWLHSTAQTLFHHFNSSASWYMMDLKDTEKTIVKYLAQKIE